MYSTLTGVSSFFDSHCIDCPAHSTAVFGSSDVTNCTCNAGFTGPNGGHCSPCPVAKYKDSPGSSACHSCPPNSWSSTRSTDIRDCQPLPAPFVSEVRHMYTHTNTLKHMYAHTHKHSGIPVISLLKSYVLMYFSTSVGVSNMYASINGCVRVHTDGG
jgi:hypothetical protein